MPYHILVVIKKEVFVTIKNKNKKIKKKYMSIKNCPRHNSISHVYTKLTETNGKTNCASF